MRAKLSESRPDSRSLRSSDSGDSFLCCSRATCSNSDVMVARSDISAGSLRDNSLYGLKARGGVFHHRAYYIVHRVYARPGGPYARYEEAWMDRRGFLMAQPAAVLTLSGRRPARSP